MCVATWSYVDNELGGLFGVLMGTESEATHKVFTVLRRAIHQKQALEAAITTWPEPDQEAFEVLMVEYGSLEKQRNKLAHACFGLSHENPELLLVVSVEDHVLWQAEVLPKIKKRIAVDPHAGLKENLSVYRLEDLRSLKDEMKRMWRDLFDFNGHLRKTHSNATATWQSRLKLPHLQQRLADVRARKAGSAM